MVGNGHRFGGNLHGCEALRKYGFLSEVAYPYAVAEHNVAAVGLFFAGNNAQHGAFACAVSRHHSDFVAFVYAECYVAEEQTVAIAFCKVLYIKYVGH